MPRAEDLSGKKFGWLTAISPLPGSRSSRRKWNCRCDCGNLVAVGTNDLNSGVTKSCGCQKVNLIREARTIHGHTSHHANPTAEYRCWSDMISRCKDLRNPYYGGRGITVCKRWKASFSNFLEDMGPRPSVKYSIDRIEVDGHYDPANCRWATISEQANNRRDNRKVVLGAETFTVAQLAEVSAVAAPTLRARLDRGWTVADATNLPASPISPQLVKKQRSATRPIEKWSLLP